MTVNNPIVRISAPNSQISNFVTPHIDNAKKVKLALGAIPRSKPIITTLGQAGWCLWTAYNSSMTLGTYYHLRFDGAIERVTICPDGTETVITL